MSSIASYLVSYYSWTHEFSSSSLLEERGFCCCLNCVSLFNSLFFSHQDFWRLLLNVSHGGALASRDVRLGGASAPSVGSLGGAAGRFDFERATSDSTLLYLFVYFRFSLAVAELSLSTFFLAWRPSTRRSLSFNLYRWVIVLLFGSLVFIYIALLVCVFIVDDSVSWISSPRYFRSNFELNSQ